MVKIIIDKQLYNIKDSDFKELKSAVLFNDKNRYNLILKKLESNYEIKDFIECYTYKD
jgi:hypothetical protein